MRTLLTTLAATLALAGCQTWGPNWSEVTGQRYYRAATNTTPTVINLIDGNGAFPNAPGAPVRIEPGRHRLTLTAPTPSPGWKGGSDIVEFELVMEPCKRYYIAARFDNYVGRAFTPYVDEAQTIAGCGTSVAAR